MPNDQATIEFYSKEAAAYADRVAGEVAHPALGRFANTVAPGGRVLDFGCGPGWAAAHLRDQGFEVEAFDGSAGLADEAQRRYGLAVTVGRFEEFAAPLAHFDGVWCSFSLLHDTRDAMPGHLGRLAAALVPGGVFYLGLKEGVGAHRDKLGRMYTYFGQEEISGLVEQAGFGEVDITTEPSVGFDGEPAISMHLFARRA